MKSEGEPLAHAVISNGQDIGPAQSKDQQHFNGPGADAAHFSEAFDDVGIGHFEDGCVGWHCSVDGAGGKVSERFDLVARNAAGAEWFVGRVEQELGCWVAAEKLADPAMDGGGGFAVQLLVKDGFKQRLKERRRSIDAESEWADAMDECGELEIVRAQVRDCFRGIEGKFPSAAVVNHGWSVSQPAKRAGKECYTSCGLERGGMLAMKRRDFVKTMTTVGTGLLLRPSAFAAQAQGAVEPDASVRRVMVMFKCHFDAGFIDTQSNVVHKYFDQYFPHAIEIARAANAGGKRRYVWTTGSWLLFEYLEQASPADRKTMEEAIKRGDIAWHALPFTWQTEMLSPSMIEGSLALARSLDQRFGTVTTGAKMTDVPGHTRGIIPPLAKHGVTFLEIGVNGGSTAAELPPLFVWKDPSGASLTMMYHHDYGATARVPESDLALVTEVRGDNSGPHKPEEIEHIHADLAARFPNAEITACNLSEMANAIKP